MTWLPISSAPKDGTRIILADCAWIETGFWNTQLSQWMDDAKQGWCNANWPTHWQPLPAPPRDTLADSDGDDGA